MELNNEIVKESRNLLLEAWNKVCKIPKDKWCINTRKDSENRMCFLGHYSNKIEGNPQSLDGFNLVYASERLNELLNNESHVGIALINNGKSQHYKQENPKDRVKAFINDIRKIKI